MFIRWSRKSVLSVAALVAVSFAPATLPAQVTLKQVLPTDTKVVSTVDSAVEQTLQIAGQNQDTKSEQNAVQSTVYSAVEGGKVTATHKVDSLQVRLKLAGMDVAFDSANPDKEPDSEIGRQIAKSLKATLKATWESIHEPSGKLLEVKGADKFLESLDPESAAMVKAQLDPNYLKEKLINEGARIPTKPIKVGDTWDLKEDVRIGGGQTMAFKITYKYTGTTEKDGKQLHRIETKATEVTYTIEADSPIPLKLKSSDLKIADSKGELLFDNKVGRVIEDNDKVQIKGKIVFELMGMELPGDLNLTITSVTKERG